MDVVAVSVDSVEQNRTFAAAEIRRHGAGKAFGFPLLSDPGGRVAAAYGVVGSECARRVSFVLDEHGSVQHVVAVSRLLSHGLELAAWIREHRRAPPR